MSQLKPRTPVTSPAETGTSGLGEQRYLSLFESLAPLIGCRDSAGVCREACELIAGLLDVGACSLMLLTEDGQELTLGAATHIPANQWSEVRIPSDRGVCGRALKAGRTLLIQGETDFQEHFGRYSNEARYDSAACVIAPLKAGRKVLGVINVAQPTGRRRFRDRDVELLRAAGHLVASALDSAWRFEEANRLKANLTEIFDNLNVGVLALDRENRVVQINQYARELLDYEGLLPMELRKVAPEAVWEACAIMIAESQERENIPRRRVKLELGGQSRVYLISTSRVIGQLFHEHLVMLEDVGQEEEVRRLRESEEMKHCFLSIISHELRTPLTVIRSAIPMLKAPEDGNVAPQMLAQVHRLLSSNCQRLTEVVNSILDVTEIESGTLTLTLRETCLRALIGELVERYSETVREKQLELVVELDEGAPEVPIDRKRMTGVLGELINNAIKFSHRNKTIRIRLAGSEPWLEIYVTNYGEPLDPGKLEIIFDKFYQGNQSMTRTVGGVGLGLFLVSNVVRLHGGEVEFVQAGGEETTIRVRLPMEPAEQAAAATEGS